MKSVFEKNQKAFEELRCSLPSQYIGSFALMCDEEIIDFFDTSHDAFIVGRRFLGERAYSIHEICHIRIPMPSGWPIVNATHGFPVVARKQFITSQTPTPGVSR